MSNIHVLKNSEAEAVLKIYTDESSGEVIDVSLEDWLTSDKQEYVTGTHTGDESVGEFGVYTGSHATIAGMWWGAKIGKQINIQRIISTGPDVTHSYAYLTNSGFHDYQAAGFVDRIYADKDIRVTFDGGQGFIILKLKKHGWKPKVETATFGIYDDTSAVGS
jgi:hypothetical protein